MIKKEGDSYSNSFTLSPPHLVTLSSSCLRLLRRRHGREKVSPVWFPASHGRGEASHEQILHRQSVSSAPTSVGNFPGYPGKLPGSPGNAPGDLGKAPGSLGRIPGSLGKIPGYLGKIPGYLAAAPGSLGKFPGDPPTMEGDRYDLPATPASAAFVGRGVAGSAAAVFIGIPERPRSRQGAQRRVGPKSMEPARHGGEGLATDGVRRGTDGGRAGGCAALETV